ncbi:hypothetical protein ACQEWB_00740 [Streptomyces sp. CA-249302]|uniref:hypothetical protein n=1 Tax=Streptomyces sp. CA-249302 TaxID=3240058 RepID=UPI003D8AEF16
MRLLRVEGRYGPRLRDVLPALVALTVVVCALVAGLAAGYRTAGLAAPVAGGALVVFVVVLAVRGRRPGVRRRSGYYISDELLELDTQGLALAVARMLRRDGWRVRMLSAPERPHLCARDKGGHRLEVAFRPVAEPLPDEDVSHPRQHRGDAESSPLRLVVHRAPSGHGTSTGHAGRGTSACSTAPRCAAGQRARA